MYKNSLQVFCTEKHNMNLYLTKICKYKCDQRAATSKVSHKTTSTSTSNKCVARENLGLCPASTYSVQVDGEIAGVARWWMSCCKNPTYAAGTDWNQVRSCKIAAVEEG